MLLRFEIGNHRSILEPVELSMIAMDEDRPATRSFERLDEKVLTVAGIYGANASGKTNVVDGMAWLSRAIRNSLRRWEGSIPRDPFNFEQGLSQPSSFGVDLMVNEVRYRYELELNDNEVLFEALYSYPQRRRRRLFEREGDNLTFRRGTEITGGGHELVTPTTLVMSTAGRLNAEIAAVAEWLRSIRPVGFSPGVPFGLGREHYHRGIRWSVPGWEDDLADTFDWSQPRLFTDEAASGTGGELRSLALALLQFADLGIDDVEVVSDADFHTGHAGRRMRLLHTAGSRTRPFELCDESEGTLTWLSLMPALLTAFRRGGLIVVDELAASLHPSISSKLIQMFQDPSMNRPGGQIVFTSHDVTLLGYMNRDEVWLTSKRPDASTVLTPLSDYRGHRVRRSANLEHAYLEGRFGGTPVVDPSRIRQAIALISGN